MKWYSKNRLNEAIFQAPKLYVKSYGLENIYYFTLKNICLS